MLEADTSLVRVFKRLAPYVESVTLVVVIAWIQSMAGQRLQDRAGLTLLEIGTCYGAWRGGLFPGLTALMTGFVLGAYYLPPAGSLSVKDRSDIVSLLLFMILGLFIVAFGEANRMEKRLVLQREQELRVLNAQLAEANAELDQHLQRRTADLKDLREFLADEI